MIVVTDGFGMADVADKIFAHVSKEGIVTLIIVTIVILYSLSDNCYKLCYVSSRLFFMWHFW